MIDIRQLQCLVACVQTGSFSKAAEALYLTQPTVSKTIKSLEEENQVRLFERHTKGIELTAEGKRFYHHAQIILENLKKLQDPQEKRAFEELRVSCNPSSWFADQFIDFYRLYQEEQIHYQVYTADIMEIAQRVKERKDDLGFVYVMKDQLVSFQYFLSQNYMEFYNLLETDIMLYFGQKAKRDNQEDFSRLRLIQRFAGEFSSDNYREISDQYGNYVSKAEVVVTTNSDYIMERFLRSGDLCNISGAYLTGKDPVNDSQICLSDYTDNKIIFGCISRKGEKLPKWAKVFRNYMESKIKETEIEGI